MNFGGNKMIRSSWMLVFIVASMSALAQRDVRKEIDSEREGSFLDDKTYEKAKGFIRRDSTYYVGYMFEGAYLFFRANDKLGFNKSIVPLQKALDLIEKDYDKQLRTRTNNYYSYTAVYGYHRDYGLIAYFLSRAYQNVELQDKAMEVLLHVRNRNFQLEQNIDSYNDIAWIYHRNRVYTSRQFPFLKNSVRENVETANRYLDSALMKMREDAEVNNGLFDPSFLNRRYLGTFHYKAMIYDYKLEIDTANFFYNELIQNDAYSSNNYAEFKLAMGELGQAEAFFKEAEQQETSVEKKTKEFFYMRGTIDTYKGRPAQADSMLSKVLKEQGSTPGFGWHCIGLARAQHYEGLTAESQERINKAARFQELHIGTTWGQEQYNMAVASLNYINQLQFEKEYFFENDEWWFWFNPVNWYHWIRYSLEIRHHKMLLASLVAENPERDQVIYTIFASENLINFDEVWSAIDGFGNEYFIKVYQRLLETDTRPKLKKYFRYFLGKLYLAEGNKEIARRYFEAALEDKEMRDGYQTLLRARVFEGLALSSVSNDDKEKWTREFYRAFPQLVPYSDLMMKFQLKDEGSGTADDVLSQLKNCAIDFEGDEKSPVVSIRMTSTADGGMKITYRVELQGTEIQAGNFSVEKSETASAGKLLAYRLFGIHKSRIGEQVEVAKQPEVKPV